VRRSIKQYHSVKVALRALALTEAAAEVERVSGFEHLVAGALTDRAFAS
jgi:hypothetical protein